MLDFVPNHTALDHAWVEEHPEYYVAGTAEDVLRTPHNYDWATRKQGDLVLAYGRDGHALVTGSIRTNLGNNR